MLLEILNIQGFKFQCSIKYKSIYFKFLFKKQATIYLSMHFY